MKRAISFQLSAFSIILLLLVSCVPVATPPQLAFTPGVPVVVTDEIFDAGVFRVQYPHGWRVITGQASLPVSVIFAAPEDAALIVLSTGSIGTPPLLNTEEPTRGILRRLQIGELTLTIFGTARADEWEAFTAIFNHVLSSVEH